MLKLDDGALEDDELLLLLRPRSNEAPSSLRIESGRLFLEGGEVGGEAAAVGGGGGGGT
jgi:hypothetical protein